MNKQVRLEKWVTEKDANGNNKEAVAKYNVWADITRTKGSRVVTAGKTEILSSIKFKVRFRPEFKVSGNWRIVYNGSRHTVQSIEQDKEDRFYWIITADSKAMR